MCGSPSLYYSIKVSDKVESILKDAHRQNPSLSTTYVVAFEGSASHGECRQIKLEAMLAESYFVSRGPSTPKGKFYDEW